MQTENRIFVFFDFFYWKFFVTGVNYTKIPEIYNYDE